MKKFTTLIAVQYNKEVTVEANDESHAIEIFDGLVETDGFTSDQLVPESSVEVEFDGHVWEVK